MRPGVLKADCVHTVPCAHREHGFDYAHEFDTLHGGDPTHEFDFAHEWDPVHDHDPAHEFDVVHDYDVKPG